MGETARHARAASRPDHPRNLALSAPAALACDAGSFDPADQPPFGGQTTTLSRPLPPGARVPGFRLTPGQATALATEALTPHGSVRRFETRTRPAPAPPAVAGRLLRRGGQGRRAGGDRRQRGMRAGDVDRDTGRHQARPGIPGGGLGQGEQLVDLAAPLRSLHGAVRRPEAAASPDPSRPAGAARLQRVTRLLQPRKIGGSVGLVYPVLAYVFLRMLVAGFRPSESRDRLLPLARRSWLVAGIVALVAFHTVYVAPKGR